MVALASVGDARVEVALVVAFIDLTGYAAQSTRVADDELADVLDGYYERIGAAVTPHGGRIVKFIGDGALVVFDVGDADRAVVALLALKDDIDRYFERHGWMCRALVKVHAGVAIAGSFGHRGAKRFDVIGKAVNTAAMLDSQGVALSVEAFRALAAETRKQFKKHTWPVTYIRHQDPHRFRRR